MNWERWGRGAGVGFVVLTVAAFVVGGEPPTVGDTPDEVVAYFDGDRGQVLVSSILFAVALGFWIWFAGTLSNNLRERGEGRVAATIIGAVATFAAVQFVVTGVNAVLAYSVAGDGEAGIAKALFDLTVVLDVFAAVPSAVFFVATALGLSRVGIIPMWLGWAGLGVAALFALRATNWASDGFWSPTGGYLFILIPLALLWILATSVVLFRRATGATAGGQLPAPSI
jgi:hypothetical protein